MDQTVINATTEFYQTQISALQEAIEKKDALIVRLQDENSQKSVAITTARMEQNNFRNSVRDYVIEALESEDISEGVAEALADLCDFELTKEVEVEVSVTYNLTLQVPYNEDVESIVNDIDFESVSYNSDNITWLSSSVDRIDF
jgi:vacuolar-type H+-ATPase subunit I/STV1